jgi:HK97 family phage major capsid protein
MPALLDRLRTEYQTTQDRYRSLEALVTADGHDISETEQSELDNMAERLRSMQPRIEEAVELERSLAAGASAFSNMPVFAPGAAVTPHRREQHPAERFRSWADYAASLARGEVTREDYEAVQEVILAAEVGGPDDVRRAFVDVLTTDVPGLVPTQYITSLADTINAARPFINAFSTLPLPNTGMVLSYPTITARPLVGKQTTQKTDISSRKTTVSATTTNVLTYGGGEDVSVQVLQRTEPSYLGLMLQLYAEQMAIVMDTDAIAAAVAAATQTDITLSLAAPANWNNLLAAGIGTLLANSRMMPDVFIMGTTLWANFAGAASSDGRPLFPNINAMNPVGQFSFSDTNGNVRGLTVAVDPNMSASRGVIGNRNAFTTFVSSTQTMNIFNPSKLGQDFAVYEFAAFASRRPDALVEVVMGA